MEITVRKIGDYCDVKIEYWGTAIDLGMHNFQQSVDLARKFEEASDELLSGWSENKKPPCK